MTVALQSNRAPRPSSLADVLDLVLDKGIVIDAYVRVSLLGIELLTVDARVVIASVDTYLRFAEATNRLDLHEKGGKGLDEFVASTTENVMHGGAKGVTKGALDAVHETWREVRGKDDDGRTRRRRKKRTS
jgi:gas vesicle structural protein